MLLWVLSKSPILAPVLAALLTTLSNFCGNKMDLLPCPQADMNRAATNLSRPWKCRACMTEAVNKPYDMRIDLPKDQHFPLAVAVRSLCRV